jgi:hypothetical protein
VASGGTVTLAGSASGSAPVTLSWGAPSQGTLSSNSIANPVYTAPVVAAQTSDSVLLTATNSCGSTSSTAVITINAPSAPTVNPVSAISVFSGNVGSFSVTGSDPAGGSLTFAVTQSGTPALVNLGVTSTGATSALVSFLAPTLPAGQTLPSVVTLTITATNAGGGVSAPASTTVTINPLADQVTIQTTQYRTTKQRVDITATSTNANAVLRLAPYLTEQGTMFDPSVLGNVFTVQLGVPTLTLVGAPPPACNLGGAYATPCSQTPFVVISDFGGVSAPTALQKIRQAENTIADLLQRLEATGWRSVLTSEREKVEKALRTILEKLPQIPEKH